MNHQWGGRQANEEEDKGLGLAEDRLEIPVLRWNVMQGRDECALNRGRLHRNLKTSRHLGDQLGDQEVMVRVCRQLRNHEVRVCQFL